MARIFISYKRVDKDKVFKIKDKIESATGERCWIDMDGIESDAQFKNVIINAIKQSEIVLFMYSKAHISIVDFEKDWTVRELNFASAKNKRIAFINLDGSPLTDEFVFDYGSKQQIDARSNENISKLVADIQNWLNNKEIRKEIAEDDGSLHSIGNNPFQKLSHNYGKTILFILLTLIIIIGVVWWINHWQFNSNNEYDYATDSVYEVVADNVYGETNEYNDTVDAIEVDYAAFFDENYNYNTTASGLRYVNITEGSGAYPSSSDIVTVHYRGQFTNDTVFVSSYDMGEPVSFPINSLIDGLEEGIQIMRVGGWSVFYIPSYLAYGDAGDPESSIGPNKDLIFSVELLAIEKNN